MMLTGWFYSLGRAWCGPFPDRDTALTVRGLECLRLGLGWPKGQLFEGHAVVENKSLVDRQGTEYEIRGLVE